LLHVAAKDSMVLVYASTTTRCQPVIYSL
jgi:hypothetical protein